MVCCLCVFTSPLQIDYVKFIGVARIFSGWVHCFREKVDLF